MNAYIINEALIVKYDKKLVDAFFELLRGGLWPDCGHTADSLLHNGAVDWHEVYRLASEQSVLGLVLAGVERLPLNQRPPKMLLLQWIGEVQMVEWQNKRMNQELAELASICEKKDLEYIVVKGQTVGCLYPKSGLRQAGDIDFLVHGTSNLVDDFSRALGVDIPKMVEYEVGFDRNNIRYELHTSLRGWAAKKHQQKWDELIDNEWSKKYFVDIDGESVRTLSPTVNAAYIFIHLFFHLIREGVSLRQLCDWALVLHHYKDEIDSDLLVTILHELGLFGAYCAFETILVDRLGLPMGELPVSIDDDDRKWQGKILSDIFMGGNFGKLNHQAHSSRRYKLETMGVAMRNLFRYYRLCPSEVGGMVPRLVKVNWKILINRRK